MLISFLSLFLHSLFPLLLTAGQGSPEGTLIHGLFSLLSCFVWESVAAGIVSKALLGIPGMRRRIIR